jgi:hypothetical protein
MRKVIDRVEETAGVVYSLALTVIAVYVAFKLLTVGSSLLR